MAHIVELAVEGIDVVFEEEGDGHETGHHYAGNGKGEDVEGYPGDGDQVEGGIS